jgi:small nuclear ribonucleoprotein B and B'
MSSNIATQRSKFLQWIDFRVRITIQDGRMMVGTFLAFDKHMNVVLADTDEYRITKTKKTGVLKQIKRTLGLIIIRGENIISLTAEAPPSQTFKKSDT